RPLLIPAPRPSSGPLKRAPPVECGSLFTLLALTQEGSLEGLPPSAARACPRVLARAWSRIYLRRSRPAAECARQNMLGLSTDRYFHPHGQRAGSYPRLSCRVFHLEKKKRQFAPNRPGAPWLTCLHSNSGL